MNIPTTRVRGVTYLLVLMSCSLASSRLHADESRPDRSPAGSIQVAPSSLRLTHYRHWVSMTVSGRTADGIALDLTPEATIRSGDETIAIVEDGWVRPIKSGETTINVQAAGQTVEIPVHVELPPTERPYSFQHDVMPVLSKAGCNSGACHGYSLGKGGFKLSLRGGDALLDYQAVVGDAFGRRLNPLRPRESLVLKKPIGDIPHRGGIRFERGSLGAEILQHWIEQGAKGDLEDKVATSC